MIYIANKRSKLENLKKKYPNAYIMDLTSKAREPYVQFSPFYPHGNIPIPFSNNRYAQSVEGIWQGLKVFSGEGIDTSKFDVINMKGLKRTVRTKGSVAGHQKGLDNKDLLSYLNARLEIYLPTYKYVLDNFLVETIRKLKTASQEKDLVFLDYETNFLVSSEKPLSHAFLVKCYLEDKYPSRENYLSVDIYYTELFRVKNKPKGEKKEKNTINEPQTKLF